MKGTTENEQQAKDWRTHLQSTYLRKALYTKYTENYQNIVIGQITQFFKFCERHRQTLHPRKYIGTIYAYKKSLTSSVIMEVQIKSTRYHHTSVRMAKK